MPGLSAVVFIPDDTAKTGYSRPMMLQNIMGTPLLSWLASSLIAGGVGRFFMVCHERFRRDVRACIPDDVGFFCPAQEAVSDNTYVEPGVAGGAGSALLPGTILRGHTSIGCGCTIGPNSYLENAKIGDDTNVNSSQVYNSTVGYDTHIGPFAYIRPGSTIGSHIRVGDFVEIKNSTIADGTKISHLTYVGDSDVGQNCNFGCGTVTVNYDRAKKYRTTIGDNAFIGCNTNLIAPVTVGDGSYIAAGSTITDDIPAMALAIARARQQNKKDWAAKHKIKEK